VSLASGTARLVCRYVNVDAKPYMVFSGKRWRLQANAPYRKVSRIIYRTDGVTRNLYRRHQSNPLRRLLLKLAVSQLVTELPVFYVIRRFIDKKLVQTTPIQPIKKTSIKANSFSASHGITRILRNSKVRSHVHKSPQLVPILRQKNPDLNCLLYLFQIYFNRDDGKSITVEARTGTGGSRSLRFPKFLENWYMKVGKLSAVSTGRFILYEISLAPISVRV